MNTKPISDFLLNISTVLTIGNNKHNVKLDNTLNLDSEIKDINLSNCPILIFNYSGIFNDKDSTCNHKVFIDLNWGFIERIDTIPIQGGKRAFVHFAPGKWNTRNPEAMEVLDALRNGSQVKIVYDEPWYWKGSISPAKRPEETSKNNNNNAERKKRRKERANAAQKRINNTRKQNAGRRKKCKTRRRRRTKKK